MRIAYLDCFSGISGDMFLGALVDAGVPAKLLREIRSRRSTLGAAGDFARERSGITATKVDVFVHGEKELPREEFWAQNSKVTRTSMRTSMDSHAHAHNMSREHICYPDICQHAAERPRHRMSIHMGGLKEIREIIAKRPSARARRTRRCAIFEALGDGGSEDPQH